MDHDAVVKNVVIVGGGFAGLNAAKELGSTPFQVTLIDRRNFHVFQPLLYQVATGGLSPADICAPLRVVLRKYKNIRTILDEVTGFDIERRTVKVTDGEIPYDVLIVAAGSTHSYFGHDEWQTIAPGLKTIEDATKIRSRILSAFEAAEKEMDPDKRRDLLTFLVIGGGPTGVELAGTLGEIANDTLKNDFRTFHPEEARILLLDGGERVLSGFPPDLSTAAENSLLKLGVRVRNHFMVNAVDENGVGGKSDRGDERVNARTVIWAAGVRASPLAKMLADAAGLSTDRSGHVAVDGFCNLPGHPEIFIAGDMAKFTGKDGKPLPGVAQPAIQQGTYIGKLIQRRANNEEAKPFEYSDLGNMATIGRRAAVADLFGSHWSGWMAWLIWLFIHLMYLVGFENRVQVFVHWAFQYLTFNRGARLITNR